MSGEPKEPELPTVSDTPRAPEGPAPLFVLRVLAGRDAGKSLVLDWNRTPRVLVGQSRVCEMLLSDPRVSRRHLHLAPEGHAVKIRDLRTTNGTRISGVRVIEALLVGGESLELGETTLKIVRVGNLPEPPKRDRDRLGRVLGQSQDMRRVLGLAERLAASSLPLLVEGETGTGKELLAEAIHDAGERASQPFVVHDCSVHGGDEGLVALFGRENPGAIELASRGTLVLDEVGDLSDAAQARLLSVFERGLVQRLDGRPPVRVDVRVIATTRRDLDRQVQEGSFREELLFRITGARIEVPPLRRRHGDVELLSAHFWGMFGGVGPVPRTFLLQLARHDWPGNVRELEHAIARRVALGDDLEDPVRAGARTARGEDFMESVLERNLAMSHARQLVIEEFEQRYVERAIAQHGGNISRAAASSGMTRRYFHMLRAKRKMAKP